MPEGLLIIGASGFIGSRLALAARGRFDVIRSSRGGAATGQDLAIDLTSSESIQQGIAGARPRVVVLLAAMSEIDRCERERELAERINHAGTRAVTAACKSVGARLVYTSSDAVFDGQQPAYHETDPVSPANWYGQTKALAERAILESGISAAIVRPSLVLGRSALPGGNSYLDKVLGNLRAGNRIITPTYEVRNPIDVGTLCQILLELSARGEVQGIFHMGATDRIARSELTRAIAIRTGHDPNLIITQTEPVPGRAPRGRDVFLATDRARAECKVRVPNCQEVLELACAGEVL